MVVHLEPKPRCYVMHVSTVKKVDVEFYWVDYGGKTYAFDKEDGVLTYWKYNKRHKEKTSTLRQPTKERLQYINSLKEKRALLQRIYRITEPTKRASYDDGFKTPLLIPKEVIDRICKKLKLNGISELNRLVERTLRAEANTKRREGQLLSLEQLRTIWKEISEVEKTYLENKNFKFKDVGSDHDI